MKVRPSTWKNHSVTKLIRVPEAYADRLLELAHMLDAVGQGRYAIDGSDNTGFRLVRTDERIPEDRREICRSDSFWNIQGLCLLLTKEIPT